MDEREQIKERVDIVELINEYVPLKKSGANFKGLCPFHNEKTPSFMVSPDKQIWHCFGCSKGGDAFTFLMEKEGMEFPEALRTLGKRVGVEIKKKNPKVWTRKNKLYEINNLAARYFNKAYQESKSGQVARDYMQARHFSPEILDKFLIGFSPDSWDILSTFLQKRGYSDEEILAAGLTVKKDQGGYYDRFRGRLMFPIQNVYGDVTAFGARTLEKDFEGAKYINTPETEIYHKSFVLYGLFAARGEIRNQDLAVIVEGYTDVLASHQVGVSNVVASSGTALTPGHLDLLKRYTKNIALAFDMDTAGDMATKRGIELALSRGFNVTIINLPEGKDPADVALDNKDDWDKAIEKRLPILEYYFQAAFAGRDTKNVTDKKEIAAEVLPMIGRVENSVERHHYLQQLADKLDVPVDALQQSLKKISTKERTNREPSAEKGDTQKTTSKEELLEMRFLGLLLKKPGEIEFVLDNFDKTFLSSEVVRDLYTSLETLYNSKQRYTAQEFTQYLKDKGDAKAELIPQVLLSVERDVDEQDEEAMNNELRNCLFLLKKSYIKNKLQDLSKQIAATEKKNDSTQVEELSAEFSRMSNELLVTEAEINNR